MDSTPTGAPRCPVRRVDEDVVREVYLALMNMPGLSKRNAPRISWIRAALEEYAAVSAARLPVAGGMSELDRVTEAVWKDHAEKLRDECDRLIAALRESEARCAAMEGRDG